MFTIKIERNTRQWLGTLAVGGVIGALILTGKIPPAEYKHWEGLIIGAFFYHIVKMLNAPVPEPDALLNLIPDTGKMVAPENPTQLPPKEG
ncbi:MAG: hypothetical protein ACYC0Z_16435 [Acidobacteriaceae bacterium]